MTHRYRFISAHRATFGVQRLCRVLHVRRQGFYEHLAAEPARKARAEAEEDLAGEITAIHTAHNKAYGSKRITAELRRRGRVVNRKRVERIMRSRGIVGLTRRRRRCLTKTDVTRPPAPDLLGRDFSAKKPGEKFIGDITYLPTAEGWVYLATVIDCHTREIIGHAMAAHMRAELVGDAINLAAGRGLTRKNAIFHSDRGSQYGSKIFRQALWRHRIRPSMGRTGSCFDNAAAESFFATLKTEIGTKVWPTRAAARAAVFDYLIYYNRHRLHSTLGYRTPHETRISYPHHHALVA
jgi:transposase InsO family protein